MLWLARVVSRVGVWVSLVYLVAALFYTVARVYSVHARLMLYSPLILFPYSIAIAYTAR